MPPAARVTDMHTCPMATGPVPHVGGPILPPGVPTVLIDFLPAATVTNMLTCVGPPDVIIKGSSGVFINFMPAARLGDQTAHGGVIVLGSPTCIIGEVGSPSPGAGGAGAIAAGLAVSNAVQLESTPSQYSKPGSAFSSTMAGLQYALSKIGVKVAVPGAVAPSGDPVLDNIVEGVNPEGGTINCGNIIDAAISRLNGTDPKAVSPTAQDGSWTDIEKRHNTKIAWGKSINDAFKAVKDGGDGTTAIMGIVYSGATVSHVVVLANHKGVVGILEAQNWGGENPKQVITNPAEAMKRYNSDGGSNIGYGLLPKP